MSGTTFEFRLLGPFQVLADGRDVTPARPKRRALLALLLLHADEVVSTDALVEAIWGESPPETALSALHGHVSALRKLIGRETIETRPPGYVLRVPRDRIDADRFQDVVDRAVDERDPDRRAELLRDGLALFRGEPLSDFRFDSFAREHVLRIGELRLAATEERIETELELGRHAELVSELRRLVAADPLSERLRSQLMLALYRTGRQSDALHVYQEGRQVLAAELGIDPGPTLQRLERQILNQDQALAAPQRRHSGVTGSPLTSAPQQATPLIGRERQLEEVRARLHANGNRFWTLTGPAGTGKTRLAVEAAASLRERFPDGTFFVSLAPIADPDLVLPTIADAVGVEKSAANLSEILERSLVDRKLLLVLDNFEHLLEAAPAVSRLVSATRELGVLATSREPLHVGGERVYPVPPLGLPAADDLAAVAASDAARLFVELAEALQPDFELSESNARPVADICRRLDGLPLAIELAAARIVLFPPASLLARLDERLRLLTGGARDRPERHQTLRTAIDWSHDLLSEHQQTLFARLSVFAGGWTLEAAEAVCDGEVDVLDGLASLIDKSLVRLEGTDEEPRFTMLETLREYARERLAAQGEVAVRRRHAEFFLAFAEELELALSRSGAEIGQRRLFAELDNFRAAMAWAVENDAGVIALRLVSSLWRFWWDRGLSAECHDWCELALAAAPDAPPAVRGRALFAAADVHYARSEWEQNRRTLAEAMELLEAGGDEEGILYALWALAVSDALDGMEDAADRAAQEALERAEGLGSTELVGRLNVLLGNTAMTRNDPTAARTHFERAAETFRELGYSFGIGLALENLATAGVLLRDRRYAAEALAECLDVWDLSGNPHNLGHSLTVAAAIAQAHGEAAVAVRLLGAVAASFARHGLLLQGAEASIDRDTRAQAEAELGAPRYDEELERGAEHEPADLLPLAKAWLARWTASAAPAGG